MVKLYDNIKINEFICNSSNINELKLFIIENIDNFNVINLATSCVRAAKIYKEFTGNMQEVIKIAAVNIFDYLTPKIQEVVQNIKPRELANIVWAAAVLKINNKKLFRNIADIIIKKPDLEINILESANLIIGFANLNIQHLPLFFILTQKILEQLDKIDSKLATMVVTGIAKFKIKYPRFFMECANKIAEFQLLDTSEIYYLLKAYAKIGVKNPILLSRLSAIIMQKFTKFDGNQLSDMLFNFVTLEYYNNHFNRNISKHLLTWHLRSSSKSIPSFACVAKLTWSYFDLQLASYNYNMSFNQRYKQDSMYNKMFLHLAAITSAKIKTVPLNKLLENIFSAMLLGIYHDQVILEHLMLVVNENLEKLSFMTMQHITAALYYSKFINDQSDKLKAFAKIFTTLETKVKNYKPIITYIQLEVIEIIKSLLVQHEITDYYIHGNYYFGGVIFNLAIISSIGKAYLVNIHGPNDTLKPENTMFKTIPKCIAQHGGAMLIKIDFSHAELYQWQLLPIEERLKMIGIKISGMIDNIKYNNTVLYGCDEKVASLLTIYQNYTDVSTFNTKLHPTENIVKRDYNNLFKKRRSSI